MEMEESECLEFDTLYATKVWPEDKFPLIEVGKITLNENPKNFFGEIEQIAFCPSNIVPGVALSNDKLLQGRSFSYKDTQRYRIGANFQQLPINKPIVEVNNNTQDGPMRYFYNKGSINYKPNTLNDNKPLEHPKGKKEPIYVEGNLVRKTIDKSQDFLQAGERYRAMTDKEKNTLISNIAADMWEVDIRIQLKAIDNFSKADKEFGRRLKTELRIEEHC